MKSPKTNPYDIFAGSIIASLLILSPLMRGGVLTWAKPLWFALSMLLLLTTLLKQWGDADAVSKSPLLAPACALLCWSICSWIFSVTTVYAFESFSLFLGYMAFYYSLIQMVDSRKKQRMLLYLIVAIACFLAIFGFIKLLGLNPFPWWDYQREYASRHLNSTYASYDHLAGYLEMALPLLLILFVTRTRSLLTQLLLIYLTLMILAAQFLALSRGGWLSLAASLIFMSLLLFRQNGFRAKKLLAAVVGTISFLLTIMLLTTDTLPRLLSLTNDGTLASLGGRKIIYGSVLQMIADAPLLGSGPGSFATIFTQYQQPGVGIRFYFAHNDYLQAMAELGLPAALFITWAIVIYFRRGFQLLRSSSRQRWGFTLAALTGVVAILAHSFVDFNLHLPANALLLVTLLAFPEMAWRQRRASGSGKNSTYNYTYTSPSAEK